MTVRLTLGFITLRYDYALIVHEWDLVEQAILRALALGLHLSGPAPRAHGEPATRR